MEELDLKDLLMIFWNKKIQIILIILIFILAGIIYTMLFVTPMYTSSTTLVLAISEDDENTNTTITTTDLTLNSKLISTYSELIKSKNVLRQVISNLNIDVEEENLRKNVKVNAVSDTELIKITVSNANAEYSAKIANEIAKVFTEKVSEIYNINNVHVVDEAEVSAEPSNIDKTKDIITFSFIGLMVAILYVLIANTLDNTIKSEEEVEKQFKIPVLCSIPLCDFNYKKVGGKRK